MQKTKKYTRSPQLDRLPVHDKDYDHEDLHQKVVDQSVPYQFDRFFFYTMIHDRIHAKIDSYQFLGLVGFRERNSWRCIILWRTSFLSRETDNGELTCGWRRSTSRGCWIQYSMMQICLSKSCTVTSASTYVERYEFGITRQSKQSDSLRSLLFNPILHSATGKDMKTWNEQGLDIKLEDEKRDCIVNLSRTTCLRWRICRTAQKGWRLTSTDSTDA